jgi:hypothetical protein
MGSGGAAALSEPGVCASAPGEIVTGNSSAIATS